MRVSNTARSADWVATEYNNQNSPATFYSISGPSSVGGTSPIRWLVTDQLGTPRMIFDQTGSLANMSRHDYLPFGEEVPAGFRSGIPGYATGDNVRQQFTQKERDNETGLDYFGARYFASDQGRFTSPDPLLSSGRCTDPASWNRYAYTLNNPLRFIDPSGLYEYDAHATNEQKKRFEAQLKAARQALNKIAKRYGTEHNEYKDAKRRLDSYGDPNKANGVIVALGATLSGQPA
jgi:RHS repeat-associated protein